MKQVGQVSVIVVITMALLFGFGCNCMARSAVPVSGHHHHHCSDGPNHGCAILIHASCCASLPSPTGLAAIVFVHSQRASWMPPVEVIPPGQRISPDPRPPKCVL